MHRKVLEQCLEMRESVMDLLEHRDVLLGSGRLLAELGDRAIELDLSLAGVSDNIARHGRAIGTLTEQQKRSNSAMESLVRAVKRISRSRSRARSTEDAAELPASHSGPLLSERELYEGLRGEPPAVTVDLPAGMREEAEVDRWQRGLAGTFDSEMEGLSGSEVPSADTANCVKGVLARIEEALTRLDGPSSQELPPGWRSGPREPIRNGGSAPCGPGTGYSARGDYAAEMAATSGRSGATTRRPGSASARTQWTPRQQHAATTPRGKTPGLVTPRVYGQGRPKPGQGPILVADPWA